MNRDTGRMKWGMEILFFLHFFFLSGPGIDVFKERSMHTAVEWEDLEARKCVSFARLAKYSPEVSIRVRNSKSQRGYCSL